MILRNQFNPATVDISGQPKPVVGLPEGVLKYRVRFRANYIPMIYLRFEDRIQKHILLGTGDMLEPFEVPEAVNVVTKINGRGAA